MTSTYEQAIRHAIDRDILDANDLLLERYLEGALPTGATYYLIDEALHIAVEKYAQEAVFALYNVEENTAGDQYNGDVPMYDGNLHVLLSDIAEPQGHFDNNMMPALINNIPNQIASRSVIVNDIPDDLIHYYDGSAAFDDLDLQEF